MPSVDPSANLLAPLWRHAETTPDKPLLAYRVEDRFVDVSAREVADTVRRLAAGLIGLGVQPGERVALISHTRIEWTYLDYAIQAAGAVTVPIYETSSPDQIEWILQDSGAVALFVEATDHEAAVKQIADRLPQLRHTFVIELGGLESLMAQGTSVRSGAVEERVADVGADDLATLIYTSGTTGMPKGCMLTHRNLLFDVAATSEALDDIFAEGDSTLLFLPLAHSFAKTVALVMIERGVRMGYATDVDHLLEEFPMLQPTFVVAVPRVFEKVFNKAQHKAITEGKGKIFAMAARAATDYSRAQVGGRIGLWTRLRHALFDKLVFGKLRAVFGGQLRYAASGGAPLGERLGHFFNGIGVTILEGYGLTETSPVITVNRPDSLGVGTVGKPLPDTEVRIAEDGEVLCRGPQVFVGYWNNEAATREVIDPDGWFHTGDLGELDEQGRLRITGRKKDLIVTAGGKNVAPAILEDRLRGHPLISDSLVVGDQRPFIGALIALDAEALPVWAEEHGKAGRDSAELLTDPDLHEIVVQAVTEANQAVSRAEQIRKVALLPRDFTIAGGELTPTMKVRRMVVASEYAPLIEDLYQEGGISIP